MTSICIIVLAIAFVLLLVAIYLAKRAGKRVAEFQQEMENMKKQNRFLEQLKESYVDLAARQNEKINYLEKTLTETRSHICECAPSEFCTPCDEGDTAPCAPEEKPAKKSAKKPRPKASK